jgi:DNA-binding CsgD family transcriptional regulator
MPRGAKPFFTPEQDREVATRYQAGETPTRIGASYGVTWRPVSASLARSGITPRKNTDYAWKPTPENTAEVERLWREGLSIPKIARTVKTRNDTVSQVLRDLGIEARFGGQNRRFKDAQVEVLAAEYEAGSSLNELAARHGGSITTVRNTLRRHGVQIRNKGNHAEYWPPERVGWLRAQYEADRSTADIARELGLAPRTIRFKLRELGIMPLVRGPKGPAHHSWTGGRRVRESGYVEVKLPDDDPMVSMRTASGYILEHRLVMARILGRPLLPDETPHHKNLIRSDNTPGNLELWVTSQPSGARVADLLEWSLGLLERYMPEMLAPGWQDASWPEGIA